MTAKARLHEVSRDIIGFGCGLMTESEYTVDWYRVITALLKDIGKVAGRLLALSPDVGLAKLINDKTVYPATSEEMASSIPNLIDIGVLVIGGRCETNL